MLDKSHWPFFMRSVFSIQYPTSGIQHLTIGSPVYAKIAPGGYGNGTGRILV